MIYPGYGPIAEHANRENASLADLEAAMKTSPASADTFV